MGFRRAAVNGDGLPRTPQRTDRKDGVTVLQTLEIKLTDRAASDGGGTSLVVKQGGKEVLNKVYAPGKQADAKADAKAWVDKTKFDDAKGTPPPNV
jgi:hypothetical protein